MNWQLATYLKQNGLRAIDLVRETGLSTNTIYPIVRNDAQRVDRDTLDSVIQGLRRLTGKSTEISDILRFE